MSSFDKYAPNEINFSDEGFLSGLEFHQQLIANYSTKDTHNFGSKLFVVFLALQSKSFQKSIVTVIATVAIKPSATSTSHRIHFTSQLRFYISS